MQKSLLPPSRTAECVVQTSPLKIWTKYIIFIFCVSRGSPFNFEICFRGSSGRFRRNLNTLGPQPDNFWMTESGAGLLVAAAGPCPIGGRPWPVTATSAGSCDTMCTCRDAHLCRTTTCLFSIAKFEPQQTWQSLAEQETLDVSRVQMSESTRVAPKSAGYQFGVIVLNEWAGPVCLTAPEICHKLYQMAFERRSSRRATEPEYINAYHDGRQCIWFHNFSFASDLLKTKMKI